MSFFCRGIRLLKNNFALQNIVNWDCLRKTNNVDFPSIRLLSTSSVHHLKIIQETKEGNVLTIEGVAVESPHLPYLLKMDDNSDACPICRTNLDIKHTDVLILCQFVKSNGHVLPRRVTGLCRNQQRRISVLVAMAQKAGLMINLTPANCKKDPAKRRQWKAHNKYFDEATIKSLKNRKYKIGVTEMPIAH